MSRRTGDDSHPPLAVDLDGTLISVETRREGPLRAFKSNARGI